jgi:hypothetical protein
MKKPTVKYSEGEIGRIRIVEDFLRAPDRVVLREAQRYPGMSLAPA